MANDWRGTTPNKGYRVFDFRGSTSDDITRAEVFVSLMDAVDSNTTMLDEQMGIIDGSTTANTDAIATNTSAINGLTGRVGANESNISSLTDRADTIAASVATETTNRTNADTTLQTNIDKKANKATVTAVGDIATIATDGHFADSGKTFGGSIGNTSTNTEISNNHDVYNFVTQQLLTKVDYQGLFDYFGSQTQVQAQTATNGQTAIIYLGSLSTGVTGVQRGNYDGSAWTFINAVPAPANGMWIYAKKLLNETGTPFGMAMYKSDGNNPVTFNTASFPMFTPDEVDITFSNSGALTLLKKNITTSAGTTSVLNSVTGGNIAYNNTTTINQKIDASYSLSNPPPSPRFYSTATLLATGWAGDVAPYTQVVNVTGMTDAMTPTVDIVLNDDMDASIALLEGWGIISRIKTGTDNITAYCYNAVPTVDLPFQIKDTK